MREKLIDVFCAVLGVSEDHKTDEAYQFIDDLIDNGVTIQKWIPVTERLPSDYIPSTMYLCFWNGYIRVCKYWRTQKRFELRGKTVKVTHWMPLPSTEGLNEK